MGCFIINNSSLLHLNPEGKRNLEMRYFEMMPECHNLSSCLLTRAEAVTEQKSHLLTAGHLGVPSLSSNGEQHASQNKTQDAVKRDTSCMPRHSISFSLCNNGFFFFPVEPHRMNKTCLWDGGGLVQIERSQQWWGKAGALLWLICGISSLQGVSLSDLMKQQVAQLQIDLIVHATSHCGGWPK